MSAPNSRDREVAAGACTRRADEEFAAVCIAAYRESVAKEERERVLEAVKEWHQNWAASITDSEADDALDEVIAKLRSGS